MKKKLLVLSTLLTVFTVSQSAFASPNKLCVAALGSVVRTIKAPFTEKASAKRSVSEAVGRVKFLAAERIDNLFFGAFNIHFEKETDVSLFLSINVKVKNAKFSTNKVGFDHGWAGYLVPVSFIDMVEASLDNNEKVNKLYSNKFLSDKLWRVMELHEKEKREIVLNYINENPELKAAILESSQHSSIEAVIQVHGFSRLLSYANDEGVNLKKIYAENSTLRKRIKQYRNRESNIITINGKKYYPAGPYSQNSEIPIVKNKESDWAPILEEPVFETQEQLLFLDPEVNTDIELIIKNNNDEIMRKFLLGSQVMLKHEGQHIQGRFRGFWKDDSSRKRGNLFDSTGMREITESLEFLEKEEFLYDHSKIDYGSTIVFIEKFNSEDSSSVVIPVVIENGMSLELLN